MHHPPNQSHQHNKAQTGGTVYANQGPGKLSVRHNYGGNRSWAGWATLVVLAADVAFFLYGEGAYSAQEGDTGDLWRAVIFFLLLGLTGSLFRRWLRRRL
ncbi:hypothetical protein [Actinokineospora inagensis]|uniref:hypothetical protein n=1 Tax=Actinokineospora inagensis TaxID=103730 RepID=UPI0003F8C5F2|nr:hypothetical protein [Actinokineospora inagensis]